MINVLKNWLGFFIKVAKEIHYPSPQLTQGQTAQILLSHVGITMTELANDRNIASYKAKPLNREVYHTLHRVTQTGPLVSF